MKIAVITAWHQETPDVIRQCAKSVAQQSVPCTHIVVSDAAAATDEGVEPLHGEVIRLPTPHADWGNVARAVGSASAFGRDFDAVAYLDADNWYEPAHLESLVRLQKETGADFCTCSRWLCYPDGRRFGICFETDPHTFIDTNCFLITRAAAKHLWVWFALPAQQRYFADRHLLAELHAAGLRHAHSKEPTVNYRSTWAGHYLHFGRIPPVGARTRPPAVLAPLR